MGNLIEFLVFGEQDIYIHNDYNFERGCCLFATSGPEFCSALCKTLQMMMCKSCAV
jgi:hypothetical protein